MPNHQDLRVVKTKRALHAALLTLINQKDFRLITITELINEATINRGTFYKHYERKEDLLEELLQEIMDDLVLAYHEPYRQSERLSLSNIKPESIRVFHHVKKYENFYKMLFSNNTGNFHNIFYNKLKRLMMDSAEMDELGDINIDLFTSYQTYAIIGLIVEWVKKDFTYSVDYMNDQFVQILQTKQTFSNRNNVINKT